jgi:sulfoxide reductase heme-binding subunit YedZ
MASATAHIRRLHGAAVVIGALPLAWLAWGAATDGLGANPVERVTHVTGEWTLRFLLLTLAVTPLRRLAGWRWLAPLRRTLGLTAFGYACVHYLTYLGLDHFFDWDSIVEDVLERRFVTAGFAALLCLAPLAATSTRAMARRLGRKWKVLHRLVYVAATLGVVHFLWLVKADRLEPFAYGAILGLLLGARVWLWRARPLSPRSEPKGTGVLTDEA